MWTGLGSKRDSIPRTENQIDKNMKSTMEIGIL